MLEREMFNIYMDDGDEKWVLSSAEEKELKNYEKLDMGTSDVVRKFMLCMHLEQQLNSWERINELSHQLPYYTYHLNEFAMQVG